MGPSRRPGRGDHVHALSSSTAPRSDEAHRWQASPRLWDRGSDKETVIALNTHRIGHVYPSYTYEVSREKLREYAQATGIEDPIYRADASEVALADIVAPPTFAACFCVGRIGQLIADPDLGAHWNLVHGSQSFSCHRPVRGGDVLRCTPTIIDITAKGPMELLTHEIECADAATGELVVTSRSVIVFFADKEDR